MAVYKVIQDVEAEDKLIGPLTLKGFIYAATAGLLIFINFKLIIAGIGPLKWLLLLVFLPPAALFGVLASPLGRQQPTEVWLLARIRFMLKPRSRIWDQTGISKLVTVTAPKRLEKQLTKGLSQEEVSSRLQTLALTLDSRGWAIKNLSLPLNEDTSSDRLVTPTTISPMAAATDIRPEDDIMDEQNNPTAQNFASLIEEATDSHKLDLAKQLGKARKDSAKAPTKPKIGPARTEVTVGDRADKLELAQSGSALSVASVAKLANRSGGQLIGPSEVTISLH